MRKQITARRVLKYMLLPAIKPRFRALFLSGLTYIPFFLALVFQSARLLPPGHPYLNPANKGRFGLRQVLAEAANNLVLDLKHLDQIILYGLVLTGLILAGFQLCFGLGLLVVHPALAAAGSLMPTNFGEYFITKTPKQDLAFIFLDMVFGVDKSVFGSCVSLNQVCSDVEGVAEQNIIPPELSAYPWPIHLAMHEVLRFYSIGLLLVAVFITSYFIITVLLETAQTGTPFGKRFDKVWAPVRLVVAFGLLVPLGDGFNTSQYLVLYAAKFGSGFASNGWILFNQSLNLGGFHSPPNTRPSSYIDKEQKTVSIPNVPEVGGLLQFMYVARTCAEVEAAQPLKAGQTEKPEEIKPYFVTGSLGPQSYKLLEFDKGEDYENMIKLYRAKGERIANIRFGRINPAASNFKGGIDPVCGEIAFPIIDLGDATGKPETIEKGVDVLQRYYLFVIEELWFNVFQEKPPDQIVDNADKFNVDVNVNYPKETVKKHTGWIEGGGPPVETPSAYKALLQDFYRNDLTNVMDNPDAESSGLGDVVNSTKGSRKEMEESKKWGVSRALVEKGWAGAGIWYNRIASLNGIHTNAVYGIPVPRFYPAVLERVREKRSQYDQNGITYEMFKAAWPEGKVPASRSEDQPKAEALWQAYDYWQKGESTSTTMTKKSNNPFLDTVSSIFGTDGLFNIRKNTDVHPLAQLSGIGRSIIEVTVRNIGYMALGGVGGSILSAFGLSTIPAVIATIINFMMTITIMLVVVGFVLFYVIPLMPFLYFFFGVGWWVKAIFEGMVGFPVWALAHIRIDQKGGLAGPAALNGYFLLFEIFLRPILIVFGLLASITAFSATVSVLNQTWDLVVSNVSGFDTTAELQKTASSSYVGYMRGSLDQFFYLLLYTLIVYLMATASFKLIDQIPNDMLRWIGSSASPFGTRREDDAQSLRGSLQLYSQQGLENVGEGLKSILTSGAKGFNK